MSRRMKIGLVVAVVVLAVGGLVAFRIHKKKTAGTEVRIEQVARRDLVSAVTASGKIEPKTSVDISADITGRIIDLAVREGDVVKRGQFLLQIDPAQYQADVQRSEAALSAAKAQGAQARANFIQAKRNYDRSVEIRKSNPAFVTDEALEQLKTAVEVNEALLESANHNVDQSAASLRTARTSLAKTTILAPMSGRILSCFTWIQRDAPPLSPEFLRITSAPRDNFGVIPCIAGTPWRNRDTDGGLNVFARPSRSSIWFVWTIFEASNLTGRCRPSRPQRFMVVG